MKNHLGLATCFTKHSMPQKWKDAAEAGFQDAEIDVDNDLSVAEIRLDSKMQYKGLEESGLNPDLIDTFISYDAAQRNGETALVTDCVRTILGHPARSLENFFTEYKNAFLNVPQNE